MPTGYPNARFMEIINGTYTPRTDKWKVSVGHHGVMGYDEKFSWTASIPATNLRRDRQVAINSGELFLQRSARVNSVRLTNDNARLDVTYPDLTLQDDSRVYVSFVFDETILGPREEAGHADF